ncbi:hypothetical protein TTHERM_00543600 (macronuclear) [Tetrahymena thermophila SB210]|uniref:Uncharacterized protein n=1 Tax=Tetrahymena thermophila (strain SB210) TaxID=312017 RepID=I7LTR7_TETTS|nr:hypothetical protein TTHERM_00543600 [Tetrahymena thermophila SB210]EAR86020.3 hypothetical protein TTHERM_00543600 [Tetrahymena thermophila SB210]|eukprot:XP_976615.3 hypothetical protein TTHERM_00543600 [Tetrahymena thermophila SB210]
MNFVFNDENFQQNLTNQYLQQILQLKSIYGTILSQNEQQIQNPFQMLLLQQLLQLQQSQLSGAYHDFYNQNSSIASSPIPYLNTENPPEYPQFYQFPRIYNAQIDQLNQFQDPKCKYNLGSKKDKDKGVDLNTLNTTTLTAMRVDSEQQQTFNQSLQQVQIGGQDMPKIPKPMGFQRVSKKIPTQNELAGVGSQISQSTAITKLQEINFSLAKTEEQIIRDKSETNVDSASISGTKSPVFPLLSYSKVCDQEANSQQETACEFLGTITMNKQSSNKKDISEEISNSNCLAASTISSTAIPNSQYQSIIKDWDFQKLKNITDPLILKDIADCIFKNQIKNAPQSQSYQILQGQHSQFTSSTFNQFYDQLSEGKKCTSFILEQTQNSTSSSTPSFIQLPQSSSTSSSLSSPSPPCCFAATGNQNCNQETKNAITGEGPSELQEKKNKETNHILKNIYEYLDTLNLNINFKQNENYDLIISKKFLEKQEQTNLSSNVSSHQSPELRDAFDQELLAASSLNQINTSLLEQEDAIIEEGIMNMNNQGSSSEGTDEENQHENENYEPVKVKKRSGKLDIAPLEQLQSEKQSSSPVLKPQNDTKYENCIQAKCSMANKNAVLDQSSGSQNRSSVQDTFMNARRNKKREQKIQQTIEQNSQLSTKFHNLTRLLMYKIIQIFKDEANLRQTYNISPELSSSLKSVAGKIKQHSRDTCKSSVKTNFYTHSHYNALFLTLNEENVKQLAASQKDVDAHKFIFGLDLTNVSAIHLTFANIVKSVAYEIVKKNLEASIMKEQISNQQQIANAGNGQDKESMQNHISNLRSQYFQRAFQGITKMSNGQIVSRF